MDLGTVKVNNYNNSLNTNIIIKRKKGVCICARVCVRVCVKYDTHELTYISLALGARLTPSSLFAVENG